MQTKDALFIGGGWHAPSGTAVLDVVSPSTEEVIGRVPVAERGDVDAAVAEARKAFEGSGWRELSLQERAPYLRRLADALDARAERLAATVTSQNGTPIAFSRAVNGQAPGAILRYYADLAADLSQEELRTRGGGRTLVRSEPLGVVGIILPWNYPQALIMFTLAPALLAGCAAVLKPAPQTPLDSYDLAEAVLEAGLPPGLVNIVPGGVETGRRLVEHPGVDKIAFTGSTAAGRAIGAACGAALKPVTLELGGKSAALVLDDAPLEAVLEGIVTVCLPNTGQTCHASTRLLLPRSRYEEIVEAVADHLRSQPLGDPFDESTVFGPLVSARQRSHVEEMVEAGLGEGAVAVTGGGRPRGLRRGFFVEPTLLRDVHNGMTVAREEIFGPVIVAIPHDGDEDAVRIANDSAYGLGGSVWTADVGRGVEVARQVWTGTVGVNSYGVDVDAPFGGRRASGLGSELGPEGVRSFCLPKSIYLGDQDLPAGTGPGVRA